MSASSATCIGFYGFKGGAGRSQLAAHVYAQLASNKEAGPILVIDWDLEAPGIGDMLDLGPPFDEGRWRSHRGINELAQDLREFGLDADARDRAREDKTPARDSAAEYRQAMVRFLAEREWVDPAGDSDFRLRDDCWSRFRPGAAERPDDRFLGPGLFVSQSDYAANMVTADWLGQLREGYGLFDEAFWELIRAKFAYILLDLRTGFNTASFGAMARIVDKLVIVSPSRVESLAGVEAIAELLTRRDMPVWLATSYHVRSTEQGWIPEADRDPYVLATSELLKASFQDFRADKLITLPRSEVIANTGRRLSPRVLLDHMTGEHAEDDAAAITRIESLLADVPNLDSSIATVLDGKLNASAGYGKSREIRRPTSAFGDNANKPREGSRGIKPTWSDLAYYNAMADLCAELCEDARPTSGTRFRIPGNTKEFEMTSRLLGRLEIEEAPSWIATLQTRLELLSTQFNSARRDTGSPPGLERWLFDSPIRAEEPLQDGLAGIKDRPSIVGDGETDRSLSLYTDYAFMKLGLGRFFFDLFQRLDNPEPITRECARLGIALPQRAHPGNYWDYLTERPRRVFNNAIHAAIVGLNQRAHTILRQINLDKQFRSRVSQEDPANWPAIEDVLQWINWVQDDRNWEQIEDKAGLVATVELAYDRVVRHPALTGRKTNASELAIASEALRGIDDMLGNYGWPDKAYRALTAALRFHNLAHYVHRSPERIDAAYLRRALIEASMAIGLGNAGFAARSGDRMVELSNRLPNPGGADVGALSLDTSEGLHLQNLRLNLHLYPSASQFDLERWAGFDEHASSFERERATLRQFVRHARRQDRKLVWSLARDGRSALADYKMARATEMVDDFASAEPPLAYYRNDLSRVEARIAQTIAACPPIREARELTALHRRIARLLWLSGRRHEAIQQIDLLSAHRASAAQAGLDVFAIGPVALRALERIALERSCLTIGDYTPQAFSETARRGSEAMMELSSAIEIAIPGLQPARENVNLLRISNSALDSAMAAAGRALSSQDEAWAAVAQELAQMARERARTFGRSNGKVDGEYKAAHALLDYRHALLDVALAREKEPDPPAADMLSPARARAVHFAAQRFLFNLQPEEGTRLPRARGSRSARK